MNIEQLQEIKTLASEALKGRQRLENLHKTYLQKLHQGETTRALTTTYNARTADIVENIVDPSEKRLKAIFNTAES